MQLFTIYDDDRRLCVFKAYDKPDARTVLKKMVKENSPRIFRPKVRYKISDTSLVEKGYWQIEFENSDTDDAKHFVALLIKRR